MLPGASEEEALDLLRKYFRREKVRLEVIGKGDPKKSTLPITQPKTVKEGGGGALRTTVGGRSESILSRASALRRQSGGGCMSAPQASAPISSCSPLVPRPCLLTCVPSGGRALAASRNECTFSYMSFAVSLALL